ncbi:MAG TPA: phytanoyl-CoA dioxygenase family protein [Pseudomonadales bacterium]|nr:phytanoyl-CoA dioxygenase family protein [Pseudomonadales bacterium]
MSELAATSTVARHTPAHVEQWRRDGCAIVQRFFAPDEVAAVQADFVRVFGRDAGADAPLVRKPPGEIGRFNQAQFTTFDAVPFDCSPALNLIGVHPALIAFARDALHSQRVHLYQCQAWAKYTGDADYDQPFHCDYVNHTLTAPSNDVGANSIAILCYFSDVTETHGPMHYVPRSISSAIAGPEATLRGDPTLQARLREHERSSAAPAGTIVPYGIDVFHRGTNMTAPRGHRFAVMACYKRAGDDAIGYHAWQFHHMKPWARIFDHATPEQLECFGVQPPGDPFWNETTLARAHARYPNWDLTPYRERLRR